jgi:predicted NBD/HSP70 family sugar kinase
VREYLDQGGAISNGALDEAELALEINRLARSGDSTARYAYGILAGHLAEGIANVYNLLDPQAVILSGGLIEGYKSFVTDLQERVARLLHFGAKRDVQLRASSSGRFAGVQGAAVLALAAV